MLGCDCLILFGWDCVCGMSCLIVCSWFCYVVYLLSLFMILVDLVCLEWFWGLLFVGVFGSLSLDLALVYVWLLALIGDLFKM